MNYLHQSHHFITTVSSTLHLIQPNLKNLSCELDYRSQTLHRGERKESDTNPSTDAELHRGSKLVPTRSRPHIVEYK